MAGLDGAFDELVSWPDGVKLAFNGGDECVAVAQFYHGVVLGLPVKSVVSATDWWTKFLVTPARFLNYSRTQTPTAGALFVAKAQAPYDRKHGHIGLVLSVNGDGTFNTLEQNAGTGSKRWVWRYRRDMTSLYGFLVPRKNPAGGGDSAPPASVLPVVPLGEVENMRGVFFKSGSTFNVMLMNDESGFCSEYTTNDAKYNDKVARAFQTGSFLNVTEGHYKVLKASLAAVRAGQ